MRLLSNLLVKPLMLVSCFFYSITLYSYETALISKQLTSIESVMGSHEADKNGKTTLMVAAEYGFIDVIEYLIQQGANVNQRDKNGNTALNFALSKAEQRGSKDVVMALLLGWKPNAFDMGTGFNPLSFAVEIGDADIVQQLIEKGADINQKNAAGRTALHQGAFSDNPEMIKLLLAKGANINSADREGMTPLMDAIERGNFQSVSFLVNHGANIHQADHSGFTALTWAVRNHHSNKEIITLLLDKGADPNKFDKQGRTPLMWSMHDKAAMDILLTKGADLNKIDPDGNTLLITAVHTLNTDTIRYLLSKGADVNLKDSFGRTAKQIAIRNKHPEIASLLNEPAS